MNIDGLSQFEIEQEFDQSKVRDAISNEIIEYAEIIESREYLIEEIMVKYLDDVDILDVKEIVITLLTVLGNHKSGINLGQDRAGNIKPLAQGMKKIYARDIPFAVVVKTIYKDQFIAKLFKHEALNFVMDLIVHLDEIFFDIIKRVEMVEDGQFRTLTYIRSEILFAEDVNLRAHYERFRLPMIDVPHNWTQQSRGGYYLNKSRVMTNMGETNQPQNVLDVLNSYQHQAWTHSQDLELEYQFNITKFIEDGDNEATAKLKADAMKLTCQETYEAIGDKHIYFEWKYDSRLRHYSTGYDINLQGNKAKKGALRPVLWIN